MRKTPLFLLGLVVLILVSLGLVVLFSASGTKNSDLLFYIKRQSVFLAIATGVLIATAWFDYRKFREYWGISSFAYVVVFLLLCLVFAFPEVKGSHRWIPLGPIKLQPNELAKVIIVLVISIWMDKAGWRVELFLRGAFWPAVLIAGFAAPVLCSPDYGSLLVICAVSGLIMFVAGVRFLHLLALGAVAASIVLPFFILNENRMRRLSGFMGVDNASNLVAGANEDPSVYQVKQSLIAFQNSGLWGVGLGNSMQKYSFLPEAHTDFIFAIGVEELGIVFTMGVVALFIAFFILSIYIAKHAADRLGKYLVVGMSFIIYFQAMFNLGVVCKAMPTKGVALPFFSYGGTHLIVSFFALGIILSVGIHSLTDKKNRIPVRRKMVKL